MKHLNENKEFVGWKPVITILLGTGMRIGECLGLRWEDLDFDARTIDVNHNLVYRRIEDGKSKGMIKHINTPKTAAGNRKIPMLQDVYDAFLEEYQFQRITGFCEEEIEGYSGFVFSSAVRTVTIPEDVNRAIQRITDSYNVQETKLAREEKREPLLIPHFSAHHLRHTFCTRFCENETNLKVIQSIMGHADISTTMDIYAEATEEKKQEIIASLENKILIQ
jgi:integrase